MFHSNVLPCQSKVFSNSYTILFWIMETKLHAITCCLDLKETQPHSWIHEIFRSCNVFSATAFLLVHGPDSFFLYLLELRFRNVLGGIQSSALQGNNLISFCSLLDINKDQFSLNISDQEKKGFELQDLKEHHSSTQNASVTWDPSNHSTIQITLPSHTLASCLGVCV